MAVRLPMKKGLLVSWRVPAMFGREGGLQNSDPGQGIGVSADEARGLGPAATTCRRRRDAGPSLVQASAQTSPKRAAAVFRQGLFTDSGRP